MILNTGIRTGAKHVESLGSPLSTTGHPDRRAIDLYLGEMLRGPPMRATAHGLEEGIGVMAHKPVGFAATLRYKHGTVLATQAESVARKIECPGPGSA